MVCPRCGSLDRQRHLWALLERDGALECRPALMEVGPSLTLMKRLESRTRYVSVDLQAFTPSVVPMNVTRLEFPGGYFQVILCQDVVEHVRDDGAALAELYRVVHPGGHVYVTVPQKSDVAAPTDDYDTPDRHGHWHTYGTNAFRSRLESLGFGVHLVNLRDDRPELALDANAIFVARKPESDASTDWDYSLLDWMSRHRPSTRAWQRKFVHKPLST